LVVETLQDPVEAAQSPNGIGNVACCNGATRYDWSTGRWIRDGDNGRVYQVPLSYPGADRGGNMQPADVLLYDPVNDASVVDSAAGFPGRVRVPIGSDLTEDELAELRAQAVRDRATLVSSVRDALPEVEAIEREQGVVFTATATQRRADIAANIASAVTDRSTRTGVEETQKLVWLYTWAAVRGLPESQRAAVTEDLRTMRGDTVLERQIRNQAKELALVDVEASLALTPLASAQDRQTCASALTNGQGRIARTTCVVST